MNWLEAYRILDAEQNKLFESLRRNADNLSLSHLPNAAEAAARMKEQEPEVDAACMYFAENGAWPYFSKNAAWEIMNRVFEARDFAEFVACPNLSRKFQEQDMLVNVHGNLVAWLLVDYWKMAGIWRKLYQLGS